MNELKPCPFCGATDIECKQDDYGFFYVVCNYCGGKVDANDGKAEFAIKGWNTRIFPIDEEIEKEANGRYIAFEGSIQYQWAQDRKRGFLECAKWLRSRLQ